jgi:hypothetical protein
LIQLLGVTLYHPDVVFTDLGLAVLGMVLGARMRRPPRSSLTVPAVLIFCGQAAAALAGAIFHGFFVAGVGTPGGYAAWLPVPLSIDIVAASLLGLSIGNIQGIPSSIRRATVTVYAVTFASVILLVNESFATVVRFYAPVMLLFLATAAVNAWRMRSRAWGLIAASFAISAVATVVQQTRVGIHPAYFDHNALYHVLQAVALVVLYLGFRKCQGSQEVPGLARNE